MRGLGEEMDEMMQIGNICVSDGLEGRIEPDAADKAGQKGKELWVR